MLPFLKLMKIILLCLIFIITNVVDIHSQNRRDALWCFGDSTLIDFNQAPPYLDYCATRGRGSACSIADSSGNLLFYAHTANVPLWLAGYYKLGVVWNSDHQLMENGDSLIGTLLYNEIAIIPDPVNLKRYYLIYTDVTIYGKIYYSVVDLNYNGGLGKVTSKNILIDSLINRKVTDCIAAIKHGNGRDWWILFRTTFDDGTPTNTFYKLLVTPSGIALYNTQNIGFNTWTGFLRLYFSHSGNKLVLINTLGLIELYDFDRCSGTLSSLTTIQTEDPSPPLEKLLWSAEFSPNDSVLYVSTNEVPKSFLFQYNLYDSPISSSKLLIDTITPPTIGGELSSAPDGKIYWACMFYDVNNHYPYADSVYNTYNMNLSVINQPNILGLGCDFQPFSFYLGGHRTYLGLPNNPNYDMFALGGSTCDTLGLPNTIKDISKDKILFSPNPFTKEIKIINNFYSIADLTVINSIGQRKLYIKSVSTTSVDLSFLPSGYYTITYIVHNQRMQQKMIKVD